MLRKEYDRRALKAIGIVLFLTLCTTVMPYIVSYFHPQDIAGPTRRVPAVILGTEVLIPETKTTPPKAIMPEASAPPPSAETRHFAEPRVVPPELVKPHDVPPATDELADKLAGPVTNKGKADGSGIAQSGDMTGPTGNGGTDARPGDRAVAEIPAGTVPVKNPDEWPEFPGGKKALQEYLSRNIRYPAAAAEAGLEGQVVVAFVVDERGEIAEAKIIRQLGGGCDQESLRVVNAMPKWKPGRKNGRAVKVYYLVPVSFRLRQ